MRWAYVAWYICKFHEEWKKRSRNIKIWPQQLCITVGRDLWWTPMRWVHMSWLYAHNAHQKVNRNQFLHAVRCWGQCSHTFCLVLSIGSNTHLISANTYTHRFYMYNCRKCKVQGCLLTVQYRWYCTEILWIVILDGRRSLSTVMHTK